MARIAVLLVLTALSVLPAAPPAAAEDGPGNPALVRAEPAARDPERRYGPPVVDGHVLPDDPSRLWREGRAAPRLPAGG